MYNRVLLRRLIRTQNRVERCSTRRAAQSGGAGRRSGAGSAREPEERADENQTWKSFCADAVHSGGCDQDPLGHQEGNLFECPEAAPDVHGGLRKGHCRQNWVSESRCSEKRMCCGCELGHVVVAVVLESDRRAASKVQRRRASRRPRGRHRLAEQAGVMGQKGEPSDRRLTYCVASALAVYSLGLLISPSPASALRRSPPFSLSHRRLAQRKSKSKSHPQ